MAMGRYRLESFFDLGQFEFQFFLNLESAFGCVFSIRTTGDSVLLAGFFLVRHCSYLPFTASRLLKMGAECQLPLPLLRK